MDSIVIGSEDSCGNACEDSYMCVSSGTNAKVQGICCIAIGDNTTAIGCFQVDTSDASAMTFPPYYNQTVAESIIPQLEICKKRYEGFRNKAGVPVDFADRAVSAIDRLILEIKVRYIK
jgi:hypothetical protein